MTKEFLSILSTSSTVNPLNGLFCFIINYCADIGIGIGVSAGGAAKPIQRKVNARVASLIDVAN
jgi:urea transporter